MAFEQRSLDDYIDVAQRIADFRERYPEGTLQSWEPWKMVMVQGWEKNGDVSQQMFVCYTAAAYRDRDDPHPGIGVAWEIFPGRTPYTRGSELQNAETSAWGRAIIAVGASDSKRGIASREEVRNRQAEREEQAPPRCAICFHMRGSHFREGCDADSDPEKQCGCKTYQPLPTNRDGSLSRSRTTDEEKDTAGVMTSAQHAEHTQLAKPPASTGPVERLGTTPVDDPWLDGPAGLSPTDDPEDRPGTSSAAQIREMHALFGQLGVKEREERLALTRSVLGMDMLASSKQLSYRQAGDLLLALRDQAKARAGG